ncbi:adenylyl-sulfate kinase [Pelagibacteraceae bacterium]|jgi:adenylylsulfate kinase-like enzyme|nr:adenylyl-sulfate kinase [Pelagibacteraceae bacterium]MDC1158116.1 adenylyl-sulfate kinase [Pelagibacteraceae bacterium]
MNKKNIKNKKKGIFFFITGLSGSGKSTIAKYIKPKIQKYYGKTILFHGDEIRKIFNLNKYSKNDRKKIALQYVKLCKKITNENINVILATVSLYESVRKWNKKNFENYIEIYIECELKNIIKQKKKFFYKKKTNNVVGISFKPELPKNPSIILPNNFTISINELGGKLFKKIKNL